VASVFALSECDASLIKHSKTLTISIAEKSWCRDSADIPEARNIWKMLKPSRLKKDVPLRFDLNGKYLAVRL
jgi:hypothetical protein